MQKLIFILNLYFFLFSFLLTCNNYCCLSDWKEVNFLCNFNLCNKIYWNVFSKTSITQFAIGIRYFGVDAPTAFTILLSVFETLLCNVSTTKCILAWTSLRLEKYFFFDKINFITIKTKTGLEAFFLKLPYTYDLINL